MKNRAYVEYIKQGLIIGNNVNIDYGAERGEEEKKKYPGALVADPELNDYRGIKLFGTRSMYVFDNVIDMDFTSMYPSVIIVFNISANCMIGKLIIDADVETTMNKLHNELAKDDENNTIDDPGKEFVDNLLTGDIRSIGKKWFNLPGIEELIKEAKERFVSGEKVVKLSIPESMVDKYYVGQQIVVLGAAANE